jgi:hypothetical protein
LLDGEMMVIANAADISAARREIRVEQPKLFVPAVRDVALRGIEQPQGFGKRSPRGFATTGLLADRGQAAGLDQIAQRPADRVVEGPHDQAAGIVTEEFAIPGPVPAGGVIAHAGQQRPQPLQHPQPFQTRVLLIAIRRVPLAHPLSPLVPSPASLTAPRPSRNNGVDVVPNRIGLFQQWHPRIRL